MMNRIKTISLSLPLLAVSLLSVNAVQAESNCTRDRRGKCKATGRPELEVVNRTNKEVRCDLLDYDGARVKGNYYAGHASVTVAATATKRNAHRFVNRPLIGAICYFTGDYPQPPSLSLKNGLGPGPFRRTEHFPDAGRGKVILTVYSNISRVTVSSTKTATPAPKPARKRRRR